MMMRLFIAIPLSDETKKSLQKIQQLLPAGVQKQRTKQMHITLRFLGKTAHDTMAHIKSQLNEINEPPFKLAISGTGSFPLHGKAKVIWAAIKKCPALINLQQNIETICIENGLSPEARNYIPHITLGRVKNAKSMEVKTFLEKHSEQPQWIQPVNSFVLFESKQAESGVLHKTLETYKLNPNPDRDSEL